MRVSQLQAGSIALPETKAGSWVWPAQRTDGQSPASDAIPEGTRFRLDPALDVASLNLPPTVTAIALAAQRYGIVVRDRSGSVSFYAEDPGPYATHPYTTIFAGKTPAQILANFPWSRLQVIARPAG